MKYSLLMFTGIIGNVTYGSQNDDGYQALEQLETSAMRRIRGDLNGDTAYLHAVRTGNADMVDFYVKNFAIDPNAKDRQGNTDLMLAIKGGDQDDWGENYQIIFAIAASLPNRNWNVQNKRGQTALLLSVGWGRLECIDVLLGIARPDIPNAPNPNIPIENGATPLIAAIGNTMVPQDIRIDMVSRLIAHPWVNVNQRGPDNKLPLQLVFEAGLALQFCNPICRRSLEDYDATVRNIALELMNRLQVHTPSHSMISALLNDQRVNVDDYSQCDIKQLIKAILVKIEFILNHLPINPDNFRPGSIEQLRTVNENTQLYNNLLTQKNLDATYQLFTELH
ncbi:MAG: ankyrin repeat domain-containing protein [Puniceicoccales bacterium]|nr:ankyrin repeat domain-containing protein [Puniceicoccales bacterium]